MAKAHRENDSVGYLHYRVQPPNIVVTKRPREQTRHGETASGRIFGSSKGEAGSNKRNGLWIQTPRPDVYLAHGHMPNSSHLPSIMGAPSVALLKLRITFLNLPAANLLSGSSLIKRMNSR